MAVSGSNQAFYFLFLTYFAWEEWGGWGSNQTFDTGPSCRNWNTNSNLPTYNQLDF